jgi:hypothetical protein
LAPSWIEPSLSTTTQIRLKNKINDHNYFHPFILLFHWNIIQKRGPFFGIFHFAHRVSGRESYDTVTVVVAVFFFHFSGGHRNAPFPRLGHCSLANAREVNTTRFQSGRVSGLQGNWVEVIYLRKMVVFTTTTQYK